MEFMLMTSFSNKDFYFKKLSFKIANESATQHMFFSFQFACLKK